LPIADCRLPIDGLSIVHCRLGLPIVDLIADWRLAISLPIGDCRLARHPNRQSLIQIANLQSSIESAIANPNLQSPIGNP
jgi:hypothetical protein